MTTAAAMMHTARSTIMLLALALTTSGCMTSEEVRADHRAACEAYGFKVGTDQFASCLLNLDLADRGYLFKRRRAPVAAVGAGDMIQRLPAHNGEVG
jgi:hypothetical protein